MEIKIGSLEEIHEAAKTFIQTIGEHRVFAFFADMGTGKTTFIKAVCEELGVEDVVTSPTFALVNRYNSANGRPIFHFDFYRIERPEEAFDMGYEEYFYSDGLCLVEWSERIEELLPDDVMKVEIEVLSPTKRHITID